MKDFKKYYIINTTPEILYQALTNAATIQLWTGEPAIMDTTEGSEFSLFDDSICGKNIAFEHSKKIVQEWYFGEQEIPSIVTIILHEDKEKTSVELRHTNIPEEVYKEITEGWSTVYFGSLKLFYEGE
jgi:activator of HSP90 ATPase